MVLLRDIGYLEPGGLVQEPFVERGSERDVGRVFVERVGVLLENEELFLLVEGYDCGEGGRVQSRGANRRESEFGKRPGIRLSRS